jgi:hypothetical protein
MMVNATPSGTQQAETTVVLRANKIEMLRRKLPRKIGNAKNGCLKC